DVNLVGTAGAEVDEIDRRCTLRNGTRTLNQGVRGTCESLVVCVLDDAGGGGGLGSRAHDTGNSPGSIQSRIREGGQDDRHSHVVGVEVVAGDGDRGAAGTVVR